MMFQGPLCETEVSKGQADASQEGHVTLTWASSGFTAVARPWGPSCMK